MRRTALLVVVLAAAMLVLPACSMNPEADLLAARTTFTGTVRAVTVLRSRGAFTKSEGATVEATARGGLAVLDSWEAQIILERQQGGIWRLAPRVKAFRDAFREVLHRLTTCQVAGERYLASQPAAAAAEKADRPEPVPGG